MGEKWLDYKIKLVSDVDLGIFLSGGLDSSLIASIIKKLGVELKSYTIGFEEKSFDESYKAKYMSDYLNIENENFLISENDLRDIDKIVMSFGEPLSDTSVIPTYLLSKFASKLIIFKPNGVFFILLSVLNTGEINTKLAFKLFTLLKSPFP